MEAKNGQSNKLGVSIPDFCGAAPAWGYLQILYHKNETDIYLVFSFVTSNQI